MAALEDRSVQGQARWRVRWRDGRGSPWRGYTFVSPKVGRTVSDAERAARKLEKYVELMGHQLGVLEALVGAGFRIEGLPAGAAVGLDPAPAPPAGEGRPGHGAVTGGASEPDSSPQLPAVVTVAAYAERWLAGLTRANARSRADYEQALRRHVLPSLGDLDIAMINPEHIALWLRSQESSNTGRPTGRAGGPPALKSIANRHAVLSALLESAAQMGLRTGNPARGLGPTPKSTHREMCFLTQEEWSLLHRALYREVLDPNQPVDPTFGQDLALLLVASGLRYSEATALTVGQCELLAARAVIRVDRAWKRLPDGAYVLGPPKSRRGVRSVEVGETLRAALLRRSAGKGIDDLVFAAPRGGVFLSSWFHDRYWKPALKKAAERGLAKRPRVHDLRHTHAAWLIAEGRPLPSIQARLGHESITTTIDRYGHLLPDLDSGNAAAIDRALSLVEPNDEENPL